MFDVDNLRLAWERSSRDYKRPDVWSESGRGLFRSGLSVNLQRLSDSLISGEYSPVRPLKFFEAKKGGTVRSKTALSAEDAIVYQCFADHVARRSFEVFDEFSECVFGDVLLPEAAKEASMVLCDPSARLYFMHNWPVKRNEFVNKLDTILKKDEFAFKLEADVTGFFDSINHSILIDLVQRYCSMSESSIGLFAECLTTWSGTRLGQTPGVGIPQGPKASSVFANLFLHEVDRLMVRSHLPYLRYVDDVKVFGRNRAELENLLVDFDMALKSLGLHLNTSKTRVSPVSKGGVEERKSGLNVYGAEDDVVFSDEEELGGDNVFQETGRSLTPEFIEESVGEMAVLESASTEGLFSNSLGLINSFWSDSEKGGADPAAFLVSVDSQLYKGLSAQEEDVQWVRLAYWCQKSIQAIPRSLVLNGAFAVDNRWFDLMLDLCARYVHRAAVFNWCLRELPIGMQEKERLKDAVGKFSKYENVQVELLLTLSEAGCLDLDDLEWCLNGRRDSDSDYVGVAYLCCALSAASGDAAGEERLLDCMSEETRGVVFDRLLYYLDRFAGDRYLMEELLALLTANMDGDAE